MKSLAYILPCIIILSLTACTKDNDGVKEVIETTLPAIEVTSLGLMQQVGPFAQADVISVTFGGAITKTETGAFDIAWYDAPSSGAAKMVDSVHFDAWTQKADASTANNAITTTFIPTTYPNTQAFSGKLALKLSKLATGNKAYTLRIYARTKDNQMATVSVSRLITVK